MHVIYKGLSAWRLGTHNLSRSLSRSVIVRHKPIHGLLDTISNRCELVVRQERAELLVARSLLVLSVRLRRVANQVPLELHGLRYDLRHLLDANLGLLVDTQNDRVDGVVVSQCPQGEEG